MDIRAVCGPQFCLASMVHREAVVTRRPLQLELSSVHSPMSIRRRLHYCLYFIWVSSLRRQNENGDGTEGFFKDQSLVPNQMGSPSSSVATLKNSALKRSISSATRPASRFFHAFHNLRTGNQLCRSRRTRQIISLYSDATLQSSYQLKDKVRKDILEIWIRTSMNATEENTMTSANRCPYRKGN